MRTFPLVVLALLLATPLAAQTHTGTLNTASLQRDEGIPYNTYPVTLVQNQRMTARIESADFDTFLLVSGPGDVQYQNDDYEGSTSVSQIEFVAPVAGTYNVWASAYDASVPDGNAYTLVLTPGAQAMVETVQGRIDPDDQTLPKGERADTITRTIEATGAFDIELVSYGFDGYLAVQSPSGQWYRNDDAGDTQHSRVADLAPEAGTWRIIITSASAEEYGAYDLRILTYPR